MVRNQDNRAARKQDGLTIIELMIAMVVLAIGILASMSLVIMAINGNFRSKQQSNSVALAQMATEKIMSIPAWTSTTLTIADCTGATHNVSTAIGGATLNSSGDVDYTQATVTNYYTYDVRWRIDNLTAYTHLLTVSARLNTVSTGGLSGAVFGPVVTIKTVIGQGT